MIPRLAATALVLSLACLPARGAGGEPVTGSVTVQPIEVQLTLSATEATTGTRVRATSSVRNLGSASLEAVTVALRHPDSIAVARGDVQVLPRLRGGERRSIRWELCPTQVGTFGLLTRVEARMASGLGVSKESPTVLLHVPAQGRRGCG